MTIDFEFLFFLKIVFVRWDLFWAGDLSGPSVLDTHNLKVIPYYNL